MKLVTTDIETSYFQVNFNKIEDVQKIKTFEEVLNKYFPVVIDIEKDLKIIFMKHLSNSGLISGQIKEIYMSIYDSLSHKYIKKYYQQPEILHAAVNILPPQIETQYLLWREGII